VSLPLFVVALAVLVAGADAHAAAPRGAKRAPPAEEARAGNPSGDDVRAINDEKSDEQPRPLARRGEVPAAHRGPH
jgi:hypothetical protein